MTRNRYFELKYMCLQYYEYKRYLNEMGFRNSTDGPVSKKKWPGDSTSKLAIKRIYYQERIKAIEKAASNCDPEIGTYILKAVTKGYSYTKMKMLEGLPCERDMYYDRRRRFYSLLDLYI